MLARAKAPQFVQKARAVPASLPAPVGGWNARDSLANMAPVDAVTLTNMFPSASNVILRGGYSNYATGMSGQVQTVMAYAGGATNKMFAIDAGGKNVYDVTSGGAVGAAVVTGLTNALWEYTNVTTSGGNYLYMVNGTNTPYLYDGTTWTAITAVSVPAITGVTTTTLSNTILFKNRVWFIQKNTLKAWYLPTSSIGGAAQALDLSAVAQEGGTLVDFCAWTMDAGFGLDDMLVFTTSKGEIIVYRGTDPSNSSTWALVGVWNLGAPVGGGRSMFKWGGDTLIMSYDGLLPLSSALQSDRLDPRVALSDKIQTAISDATTNYASSQGWDIFYYPKANALWVNVPVSIGQQQQYVMNTITKSWCNFTGWAANCWCLFNDNPYFGANGVVCLGWSSTYADNSSDIGTSTLQAFNYFDQRGVEKYFTRARPAIFSNGMPSISIGINVNFDIQDNLAPITYSQTTFGTWDHGLWDVALWGQSQTITNNWQGITGIGYCGAIQFKSASQGITIEWASTDVVYQPGWSGI